MVVVEFPTGSFWIAISEEEKDIKIKEIEEIVNKFCEKMNIRMQASYEKGMLVFNVFQPFKSIEFENTKEEKKANDIKTNDNKKQ